MYSNMANNDKGRRKWGGISQDNIVASELEKSRSTAMRGGASRAPPQELYRPGSGPLRKSGPSSDDFDSENNPEDKPKLPSHHYRPKQQQFNNPHTMQNDVPSPQIVYLSDKINDMRLKYRNNTNDQSHASSTNNHLGGDPRKKNKKPEQPLYVPKKVKESLAEREVANRSPVHVAWEREREREENRDWDTHSNRSHRNESHHNRTGSYCHGAGGGGGSRGSGRDDHGRRGGGNRRNRNTSECEERWRAESPSSARNYGNRRDNHREIRQGSEPLIVSPTGTGDPNRTRDTRSVEPIGYPEKFQGKPPSGRRGSSKDNSMPKMKIFDQLPPRLQKKFLDKNGLIPVQNSYIGTTSEDTQWDGSTVTYQGTSGYNYSPVIHYSQTMQHLPPTRSLPPQQNWSNTIPARTRGRGRLRPEEMDNQAPMFRSVTPDQYSAPNSRPQTPTQEYMNRSYDRRGSNSTMYTSVESLSRTDSSMMPPPPPPAISPAISAHIGNRGQPSPDYQRHKRGATSPTVPQHQAYQPQRSNNNSYQSNASQEKLNDKQTLNLSPSKTETLSPLPDMSSDHILDWSEEVELDEKLGTEHLSRSSSVISLRDNASGVSGSQTSAGGTGGRNRSRKKKRDKRHSTDRSMSRDKARENSRERHKNEQNRENDNYNNNQKITGSNRRYNRIHRPSNNSQRSREPSMERNFRGGSRNPDDFHRNRMPDSHTDENWRVGRKPSICDSEDGRPTASTPQISHLQSTHSAQQSNSPPSSVLHHNNSQPSFNSAPPPGVLVLPEPSQSPPNTTQARQISSQQQRTLFDPNNPNKPIIITSPGSRAALPRENDASVQPSSVPVFQSHPGSPGHGFQAPQIDSMPPPYVTDQFGNMRPPWYNPHSESFRSAKSPCLLLDINRADLELQWILSSGGFTTSWERLSYIRRFLQESLQTLLETDIKFCQAENVEQHFWKILFYNMIEMLRKGMPKENSEGREHYKKIMIDIIDEGTVYLENLLTVLENTYKFKLDTFLASSSPPKGLGFVGLALVSAQKIFLYLGDLARYKEQVNETNNYGKSRQWYVKAQQINPKNGRPYNQLALLAHYARRKLDAVYFYMRSLMASNPFHSARESLIALFDENRKKYESTERKRKEEREWKERARMKEKEGATSGGGGLRREIWIHPGGRRVTRTTTAATASEARLAHSDLEELSQLTSVEVNKRFVTSYLHVHGKLITKIGMETFQEAGVQMLKEFRALLQHSPLPLPGTRLLQLLALNMFAIETTQLKDPQLEPGYRSEVQERALVVSLQMFSLILERGVSLLRAQLERVEHPRLIVDEDMQVLLPAIKTWCDWMLCHSTVWNPPPSCTDYRVGPPADVWSRLAMMVNLLEKLDHQEAVSLSNVSGAEGSELVRLPEDSTLSGFTPLMSNPQEPIFVRKEEDMEVAQVCLRIHKILFFGQVFLCGLETPVLKLQKCETGDNEYVSVVETSSTSSPSSPPEQSDSEILVESYSEGEEDQPHQHPQHSMSMKRLPSSGDMAEDSNSVPAPTGEIRSLIERKEELERRQRKQERHRQRVQAILQKSTVSVEIEVKPRQLVPDTNCFIDYLPQLQAIARATSGTQPIYTLMVPLVVLNELEGLARGGDSRDCPPASRAALDPEHVARVAESSRVALTFARSRNPAVRCLTTRGTVLTSSTFTVEEDVNQDGLTRNDDRILATCLSLCRTNSKEQNNTEEGQPRRLRREVVLLTEDRNLRVKALARDVPVREVPDFIQWAGLG